MKRSALFLLFTLAAIVAHGAIKTVKPGRIDSHIRNLLDTDTLYLASGSYTCVGTVDIESNIVIIGDKESRPTLTLNGNFKLLDGAERFVLENVEVKVSKRYFMITSAEEEVSIGSIVLRNCVFDFGGEAGASLFCPGSKNETLNSVGEYIIDNCIVFNALYPKHVIYTAGSSNKTKVGKFLVQNSTFATTGFGLIITAVEMESQIIISNCTFYNINTTGNMSGIFRMGNTHAKVEISKSIFNYSPPGVGFLVLPARSVKITDSFTTADTGDIRKGSGLKKATGTAAQIFEAPSDDPTAQGASFKIKDPAIAKLKVGDPRWF